MINLYRPFGVKAIQWLRMTRKPYNIALNTQAYFIRTIQLNFTLGLGLAFVWPLKKNKENQAKAKPDISPVLEKADHLFENGHYDECLKLLNELDKGDNDVEVQWRKCRILYNISKESTYSTDKKKDLINQAYTIIYDQLKRNENHFAVQKWNALLLDAKSSQDGIKERIKQLEKVKKHMDLAVAINPNDATTLHMLGEWCYQVADMPWHQRKIAEVLFASPPSSTYEDALEYFLRAETAQPRFYSLNLLRLGICYLKLRRDDQAKYYLKLAASYPAKSNDDHHANKEATELLKKLKWT